MTEVDFFGHWGYFFIAMGMWAISKREHMGWAMRLFGEGIWVWLGFKMGMTSITMWGLLFMAIDVSGFFSWKREADAEKALEDELSQWQQLGMDGMETVDRWSLYDDEGYAMAAGDPIDETLKRESKGKKVAAKRRSTRKKSVRSTRRRRSVKTNGKRRSRPNAKPRSTKKSRRNV